MKTSSGKFLNLAHYFPYDVKLQLLAHSRSFLANQKARNGIIGAENLLTCVIVQDTRGLCSAPVVNRLFILTHFLTLDGN